MVHCKKYNKNKTQCSAKFKNTGETAVKKNYTELYGKVALYYLLMCPICTFFYSV